MATPLKNILDFTGRTAIITGGSSGIGVGIAKRYAETGANVVISYFTDSLKGAAEKVVEEIHAIGAPAMAVKLDVRKPQESCRMVEEVVAAFGGVDILVNNAGIYPHQKVLECTEAEWGRYDGQQPQRCFLLLSGMRQADDSSGERRQHRQYHFHQWLPSFGR